MLFIDLTQKYKIKQNSIRIPEMMNILSALFSVIFSRSIIVL